MRIRKDYKLKKAIKIIEELGNSEKDELIKYYISNKEKNYKKSR